jgi:HK97 family phage prohead protease
MRELRVMTGKISRSAAENRKIGGHAALFNSLSQDLGGFVERIAPGAFDAVLNDDVRALLNHQPDYVLGRTKSGTLSLSVDDRGLVYEADLPATSYADDLLELVARGDVDQSSFAFEIADDQWDKIDGEYVRTILQFARLYDVSPVTYPAYVETSVSRRGLDGLVAAATEKLHALRARERLEMYKDLGEVIGRSAR